MAGAGLSSGQGAMRLPRLSHNASTINLFLFFLFFFFLMNRIAAQQNLPNLPSQGGEAATTDATTAAAAAATSDAEVSDTATDKATDSAKETTAASQTSAEPSETESSATSSTSLALGLTGLPKLAGANYPPPTVPPTANAPFMQKSNLPEGTVFIAVGAALGFFGFMVLAWRGLVAWSLHRSVKRAAMAQTAKYAHGRDPRGGPGKPKSPYFSTAAGSTLSLDHLAASGKGGGSKPHSAHTSLYFSPTAGAGMHSPSNRASGYLPAGYYAAGNGAPGGGTGMTHIGGGATSLSNLGLQSKRYSRVQSRGQSPQRSPSLPTSRGTDSVLSGSRLSTQGLVGQISNSNLNLSVAPQGRAPSAYLEDLFENHPPGQTVPEERRSSSRRY